MCKQTVRLESDYAYTIEQNDDILFHEWLGRPYRSKWGRRLEVIVSQAIPVQVSTQGMVFRTNREYMMAMGLNMQIAPWRFRIENFSMMAAKRAKAVEIDPRTFETIYKNLLVPWHSEEMDFLATLDYIDPPTGVEMFNVLKGLHTKADFVAGEPAKIVRWS